MMALFNATNHTGATPRRNPAALLSALALVISLLTLGWVLKDEAMGKTLQHGRAEQTRHGATDPASINTPMTNSRGGALLGMSENLIADVAQRVAPSVVNIDVESQAPTMASSLGGLFGSEGGEGMVPFGPGFLERFLGIPSEGGNGERPRRRVMGNGSGMVLNANGDILTNYHVVHGADRIVVTLNDGRKLPAKLIGKDPYTDLAVIRVTGKNLRPIPLGSSQTLRPGTWVLAVGSPLGFDHTVTLGIVSGISRRIPDLNANVDFIQTDAAINPGNSGGPLVNLKGQVVGINTAISGRAQNIGFAIPIDTAREVADALLTKGKVERPWVGVAMAPLSADLAESLGVPTNTTGVVVAQVMPGSPAEKAGLRPGDIVQRVNGQPVTDGRQIQQQVKANAVGATLSLQVLRGSQMLALKIKTEPFPDRMANQ